MNKRVRRDNGKNALHAKFMVFNFCWTYPCYEKRFANFGEVKHNTWFSRTHPGVKQGEKEKYPRKAGVVEASAAAVSSALFP